MRDLGRRVVLLVALATAVEAGAAVNLAGKWSRDDSPGNFTTITQTNDVVTIGTLSGTVTAPGSFTLSGSSFAGCSTQARMRLLPGETVIDGHTESVCNTPPYIPQVGNRLVLTRCECDDGNGVSGDGCDARCKVEPCFTCTGSPSVCTRLGGGSACDDHRACTVGTTCSFGFCGGGAAVPGCVDVNGWWRFEQSTGSGSFAHSGFLEERDGIVALREAFTGRAQHFGTIDSATGNLSLLIPSQAISCAFDGFSGVSDGDNFNGTGFLSRTSGGGLGCAPIDTTVVGYRCGNGTVEPGESCDDGNGAGGDGCSIFCGVEPCYACTGNPSVCTGLTGTFCTDFDSCTNDACSAGTCVSTPIECGACSTCSGGTCQPAPRTGCRVALKSSFQFLNRDVGTKDMFRWKWSNGDATTLADLGAPTTTSDVSLCVFDESGAQPTVKFRATAPGGRVCGTRSCWKAKATGYAYSDGVAGADGILAISMKSGADGKSGMQMKGKGPALSGRPFGLPTPPLALPIRVQLQVEGGACFESRHDATSVQQNAAGIFKAQGTP